MNLLKDNKAESPIEVLVTIMLGLILMTGIYFAEGNFVDGFLFIFGKLPNTMTTTFQNMLGNLTTLATIFFAIPSFFGAVLIVWGAKALLRRHGYTRTGEEFIYEEF